VNIGVLAGHGTLRMAAMGRERGEPSTAQMAAMKAGLAEGLDAGVVGLSTGLIYEPGKHARTEEIVELASTMRGTGGLYATHMRDESLGLLDSVRESISIGEQAGVPVQISHHKATGRQAWGLVSESLALIDAAKARGLKVDADQYPYTAGSTILSAVLADDVKDMRSLEPQDIVIASAAAHPEWEGKSLAELAQVFGVDPAATGQKVLAEEPGATVILHSMDEADVQTVMRHPSTMIGSDGIPTLEGRPHPRLYGTFARVLGHYARDLGLFSLEEAVHRMTGFAATKFGLTDRGAIREGAYADLVVFDPKAIVDRGTFDDPNHLPDGIVHVFVNGVHNVAAGSLLDRRPGRTLRRADAR
jgi:N-acyl-D-aspartate/D-glutamate deacylase